MTDALVKALPGELDVALAVHGGSMLHTFTEFTADPTTLRDRAAGIRCIAGFTRLLPILSRALSNPGVRVVVYIGDVFEESPARGRKLADAMGPKGIKLIVLHDTADWNAQARRRGVPRSGAAHRRLRAAVRRQRAGAAARTAGGGGGLCGGWRRMLEERQAELPGAVLLLEHLRGGR